MHIMCNVVIWKLDFVIFLLFFSLKSQTLKMRWWSLSKLFGVSERHKLQMFGVTLPNKSNLFHIYWPNIFQTWQVRLSLVEHFVNVRQISVKHMKNVRWNSVEQSQFVRLWKFEHYRFHECTRFEKRIKKSSKNGQNHTSSSLFSSKLFEKCSIKKIFEQS